MTTTQHPRRWWQVAVAAAVLVITALATVVAISRSTISFALPGGTGSASFGPGILASVVDVACLIALAILLVMACRCRRPPAQFWAALLVPLVVTLALTTYAVTAVTPSF